MKEMLGVIAGVAVLAFLGVGLYRVVHCSPASISVPNVLQVSIGGCPAQPPPTKPLTPDQRMNQGGTSADR
jgi:hypothetical protein